MRSLMLEVRAGRGPIVRNEANLPVPAARRDRWPGDCAKQSQFRRSGRTDKYLMEKELWRIEHARDLRKTKPIARSGAPRRCLDCGLGIGDRPAVGRLAPGLRRTKCAKRTQFARRGRGTRANAQNEANLRRHLRVQTNPIGRSESCETKPICRGGENRLSDCCERR